MEGAPAKIRIIATPPGEAPQWVREKWVGLELPVADVSRTYATSGVKTDQSFFSRLMRILLLRTARVTGYAVNVRAAVEILDKSDPMAASWWRLNTPQLIAGNRRFVFQKEACEEVG